MTSRQAALPACVRQQMATNSSFNIDLAKLSLRSLSSFNSKQNYIAQPPERTTSLHPVGSVNDLGFGIRIPALKRSDELSHLLCAKQCLDLGLLCSGGETSAKVRPLILASLRGTSASHLTRRNNKITWLDPDRPVLRMQFRSGIDRPRRRACTYAPPLHA